MRVDADIYMRKGNLFDPLSNKSYRLSRTKLELFMNCPRCFYLDRRFGIKQPAGYPFNLNAAVDFLLKKEFDIHRAKGKVHPLLKERGIEAIPFSHDELDEWRENFKGVRYLHTPTNFLVTGAVDDVWYDVNKELIVVDYKATSKNAKVTIDEPWQDSYKRQMEVYQWLLRRKGFRVSDVGYFVYCNAKRNKRTFGGKLEFDIDIIPYQGRDNWVEGILYEIRQCLTGGLPSYNELCPHCNYRRASQQVEAYEE